LAKDQGELIKNCPLKNSTNWRKGKGSRGKVQIHSQSQRYVRLWSAFVGCFLSETNRNRCVRILFEFVLVFAFGPAPLVLILVISMPRTFG